MRTFFFLLMLSFSYAKLCTFIPPEGWEIAQLKNPSPHVKIGFLGKSKSDFRPSINLAFEEEVGISLKEYIKTVKELQKADRTSSLRDLGDFPMICGKGRLLEISTKTPWGDIKVLQVLSILDNTAYILTASMLKEEFPEFQKEVLQSFRTLKLADDLFSEIQDGEKRKTFISFFNTLEAAKDKDLKWEQLIQEVSQHKTLGTYWTFLVLQEGHAKIYKE